MSRGTDRERAVKELLEDDGWLVTRAAGSLGMFDLVALKAEHTPRCIEVKSTAGGPWERFGPELRRACVDAAEAAGAVAELAYWPKVKPGGRLVAALRWYPSSEWPAR